MDPKASLSNVRQLITQAKNEAAAEQLLAYLTTAPEPARSWQNTVSNLLAQYKRVRRQQQRNTISLEDANLTINKITDGLLASLAAIEEGLPAPAPKPSEPEDKRSLPVWLIVSVTTALVLAVASFFMLRGNNLPERTDDDELDHVEQGITEGGECPVYAADSDFNILILPFQPLDGEPRPYDRSIRIRLASEMEKYGVMGSVFTREIDVLSNDYPVTSTQAAAIGKPCKAQLIIWGTTEVRGGEDLVTTKFRFLNGEHFRFTNLDLTEDISIDTISSLSSVANDGELTSNIEKTIRLLLGLVVYETDHPAEAADIIGEVIDSLGGLEKNPKWGLIQADSYIKSGQDERAIEIYRKMLKADTANVQARLQKGFLEYRKGDNAAAAKDFTKVLEQDPDNAGARTARAAVNIKQNDLYEAKADLEMLAQKAEQPAALSSVRQAYEEKETIAKQQYAMAEKQIRQNPNDTSAWRVKAQTAAQLGEYQNARRSASKLLRIDPNNVDAINTLQWVMKRVPDSLVIRRQLQQSIPRLSPEQLQRVEPLIPPEK